MGDKHLIHAGYFGENPVPPEGDYSQLPSRERPCVEVFPSVIVIDGIKGTVGALVDLTGDSVYAQNLEKYHAEQDRLAEAAAMRATVSERLGAIAPCLETPAGSHDSEHFSKKAMQLNEEDIESVRGPLERLVGNKIEPTDTVTLTASWAKDPTTGDELTAVALERAYQVEYDDELQKAFYESNGMEKIYSDKPVFGFDGRTANYTMAGYYGWRGYPAESRQIEEGQFEDLVSILDYLAVSRQSTPESIE